MSPNELIDKATKAGFRVVDLLPGTKSPPRYVIVLQRMEHQTNRKSPLKGTGGWRLGRSTGCSVALPMDDATTQEGTPTPWTPALRSRFCFAATLHRPTI